MTHSFCRLFPIASLALLLATPVMAQDLGRDASPARAPKTAPARPATAPTTKAPSAIDARTPAKTPRVARVGQAAPDFVLTDTDGRRHQLSDLRGRVVVLQWINPECPVCQRVTTGGLTKRMIDELRSIKSDLVHFAINSTDAMAPDRTAAYLRSNGIASPGLIDGDGRVGRAYRARTTPHVYVIDEAGILVYQGAIDDDPTGSRGDQATNYAVNTVRRMAKGLAALPAETRPYGCGVKYGPDPAAADPPARPATAPAPSSAREFDLNGDGTIDGGEREIMRRTIRARLLERYDTNGDGTIDQAERAAMRRETSTRTPATRTTDPKGSGAPTKSAPPDRDDRGGKPGLGSGRGGA
ncbi:MAG: redoxin domain-containing protein [Phycisphaerales bacterium]|nr:redoxin domain-containing protein [Phycisphaerales bacterium]